MATWTDDDGITHARASTMITRCGHLVQSFEAPCEDDGTTVLTCIGCAASETPTDSLIEMLKRLEELQSITDAAQLGDLGYVIKYADHT